MTGQRKTIIYLVQLLAATILVALNGMTGQEYVDLQRVAIGAFVLGNAAEHMAKKA